MNADEFQHLIEASSCRSLSPEEQARLREHLARDPAASAAWEEELALTQCLENLPDAPLSSRFTARVLQAAERDGTDRRTSSTGWRLAWPSPAAWRWAAAGAALALFALGYRHYVSVRREKTALALSRIAAGLDTPSEIVALAPEELWENFDAIHRLPPQADEELLAVLKDVAMK